MFVEKHPKSFGDFEKKAPGVLNFHVFDVMANSQI